MQSPRTLILFTSAFPFGRGETYLESEFPYLSSSFERVFIVSNNLNAIQTRSVPKHVKIIRYRYNTSFLWKLLSVLNIFFLLGEIRFIVKNSIRLNKPVLTTMFASFAKTLEVNYFLKRLTKKNKIDLKNLTLYSYWMNDMASGIALFKHNNPEVKAICRAHRWDIYFEIHQPPYLPLRNFILDNLDGCFCISEDGKKYISSLTSKPNNQIFLSQLGTFSNKKQLHHNESNKFTIVSCSNLIKVKRVSLIILSLAKLSGIEIRWLHFGDGPLAKELKELAETKMGKNPLVTFEFKGHFTNTELIDYYNTNSFDLFINVSESEGLPVSIMEAMSFGIPVIATNVGGVSEIVEHEKNGILLDKNCTPNEIAAAITTFLNLSVEERTKYSEYAYNTWYEKFNAEKNYKEFVESVLSL